VDGGELVEGIIHGKEFVVITRRGNFNAFKFHAVLVATVTNGFFAPRLFNEDPPHGLSGGTEKMSPAREVWIRVAHQPQPCFMHECRGLQRLVGRFIRHARRG